MEDAKEKNVELSPEDLDKVSGGYVEQRIREHKYQGTRDYDTTELKGVCCDVCSKNRGDDNNLVVPFQGGHICLDCLKKVEEKLGRKIL
ncbi:MAG: hypothetical protein Q4D57_01620 [Clostridia bacterium]|nr:hypothetical protein [Clostridia bacterium]